jgi:hypothetical protein
MKKFLLVAFLAVAGMTVASNAHAQVSKEVTHLPKPVINTLEDKLSSIYGQNYTYSIIESQFLVKTYYYKMPVFSIKVMVMLPDGATKTEIAVIAPNGALLL